MNRLLPYFASMFFLGSIASACVAFKATPKEVLRVEPRVCNFGSVRQGTKVEATFELTNASRDTIVIRDTVASCSCTVSKLSKKLLRPGEACQLEACLDVGAARGDLRTQIAVVLARDGFPSEEIALEFRGTVDPDYSWQPQRLLFTAGQPSVQTLLVAPTKYLPHLEVKHAYCTRRAFSIRSFAPVGGSDVWRVEVAFDPSKWTDQRASAVVVIGTNSKRESECHVPLRVASSK